MSETQKEEKKLKNFERLERIRDDLSSLRNEISMLRQEDKIWEDWLLPCEGGITCVLTCSYDVIIEMKSHYRRWVRPEEKKVEEHSNSDKTRS